MQNITYHCRPASEEETAITLQRLRTHTESVTGRPVTHEPFGIAGYEGKTLVGSVIGKIYSNWMNLELVAVEESHRGKGIGKAMLSVCMNEAARRGLTGIEAWTQSWQSPGFYLACGFTQLAVLEDFIEGEKRYVLQYRVAGGKA